MKTTCKQISVNEDASAVTVEWRDVVLRKQKELGRFTFQVGSKEAMISLVDRGGLSETRFR